MSRERPVLIFAQDPSCLVDNLHGDNVSPSVIMAESCTERVGELGGNHPETTTDGQGLYGVRGRLEEIAWLFAGKGAGVCCPGHTGPTVG